MLLEPQSIPAIYPLRSTMTYTLNNLCLIVSSAPDTLAYGMTNAQNELNSVCSLPCWNLPINKPDILFRLSSSKLLSDAILLQESYTARLGDSLRFGAWMDITPKLPLSSYVVAAHSFNQLCKKAKIEKPIFLFSTLRPEPFHSFDLSMPVGIGAFLQIIPQDSLVFISCPETLCYKLMASLANISMLSPDGQHQLIIGKETLEIQSRSGAETEFLAPWWSAK